MIGDTLSGCGLEKDLLQGFRHFDGKEAIGSIAIVLSTLVDDPEIAMAFGFVIGNDTV
jgi:hypothetical protein